MQSRAVIGAMAGLLFAGVSASSPAATIAPDDGVAPRWEKPQTTRRYLHGPLSERLLTFWREGKLIFAENDDEFEKLWDAMIEKLDGFGYQELYANDVAVYQVEVDAKAAVAAAALGVFGE